MTDSEKAIELEGTIMSVLPGTMFRVALAALAAGVVLGHGPVLAVPTGTGGGRAGTAFMGLTRVSIVVRMLASR